MVEILKPTEYKRIFESIDSEWDEMDIMEHLENFADYYEKTTYHFHRTLTRKLEEVDSFDPEYDVTQFLEGNNSEIPTIDTYRDAPNPALRYAKVYANYMLHVSDIREVGGHSDEENSEEEPTQILRLNSRFNEEQLLRLHGFLVLNGYLEQNSNQDFLNLFDTDKMNHQKLRWMSTYKRRFNDNLPLLTLVSYIEHDWRQKDINEEESETLLDTVVGTFRSSGETNTIGKPSMRISRNLWLPRMRRNFGILTDGPDTTPLDIMCKKIIKFIDTL